MQVVLLCWLAVCSSVVAPSTASREGRDRQGLEGREALPPRRRPSIEPPRHDFLVDPSWPNSSVRFGQVSAVTVDRRGHVVVFHRGSHVWDLEAFDDEDNYVRWMEGPIAQDTVVMLDPRSGRVLKTWGKGLFYMPHGLTIDHEENLWVTDVALHQVFKFPALASLSANSTAPLMILGVRFTNGAEDRLFCKPSAVAVMRSGDFFVSDGYCNSRIKKYRKDGLLLMSWGRSTVFGQAVRPAPYQFSVPHALALAEDRGLVCVADRENGRVQCFRSNTGEFAYEIASEAFGSRVFSVAYTPRNGGLFYLVNGPDEKAVAVQGFVVDANSRGVLSTFRDGAAELSDPHDIAVSPDGESVYVVQLDPRRAALKFARRKY